MIGPGLVKGLINKSMSYLAWIIGGGLVAIAIYWLMDWQSQHEDGA